MMPRFRYLAFAASLLVMSGAYGARPLMLDEVLKTVKEQYPPLLAAWLQQDIANGRIRQAQGAFDPILASSIGVRPMNYYDGSYGELMVEKPFTQWGGEVYGGYRLSSGFLADYERKYRTADGGEAVLGVRVPLLRDGDFDKRRAAMGKSAVDRELANPKILKQYLDFHRAARISYFAWVSAGKKLAVAEDNLRIAKLRELSLQEQVKEGAIAPITEVDNRNLVVSREIGVLNARRAFENASIELSLFYRDLKTGDPILVDRSRLPDWFPKAEPLQKLDLINDRGRAAFRRPENREIELLVLKAGIEKRLARNNLKPNLDFAMEFNQALGSGRPNDIDQSELTGLLKFSVPIGRNEANGRLQAVDARIEQLEQMKKFMRDKIHADANDAFSAVHAAYEALGQTRLHVELATRLLEAESEKFAQGASDLLALQIREQSTFDAKVLEINALMSYFKAMADYQAAVATDSPAQLLVGSK